jgi:hypothetical protein
MVMSSLPVAKLSRISNAFSESGSVRYHFATIEESRTIALFARS